MVDAILNNAPRRTRKASAGMASMDKVRDFAEKLLTPPEEGQARKIEHWLALAAAGYLSYRALSGLVWAASHPTDVKNNVIEAAIEAAKSIPAIKAQIDEEEAKSLVGIKKSLHGDGDKGETPGTAVAPADRPARGTAPMGCRRPGRAGERENQWPVGKRATLLPPPALRLAPVPGPAARREDPARGRCPRSEPAPRPLGVR